MNERKYFIVSLHWVDWLTLGSLLTACLGLLFAFRMILTLAISLMLLAMFVDMLDGLVARQLKIESDFGKYLDSFCDVFTYVLLPLFILFQFGMQDFLSICVLITYLFAGVLRLSRFNVISTVEERGVEYHLGLQVVWSQLLVVLAFPAWHWLGQSIRYPLIFILFVMSVFMIRNLRFPKPTRYILQSIIILAVIMIYFYLYLMGVWIP